MPGLRLYKADWVSRQHHTESKAKVIKDMKISINLMTDIPSHVSIPDIQEAT